jgi:quercetin dioxygenase-like cupin family protein
MSARPLAVSTPVPTLPADDPQRQLAVAKPNEDQSLIHLGVVGDTYTILLSGEDTGGLYTLIDMLVPPKGGPPPHRHDFEEMFTVLEGEIEFTFRGEPLTARAGETINVPANAPHVFTNATGTSARLLCMCTPPGQERFFAEVGTRLGSRTESPPKLAPTEQKAFMEKAIALMPNYHTELVR